MEHGEGSSWGPLMEKECIHAGGDTEGSGCAALNFPEPQFPFTPSEGIRMAGLLGSFLALKLCE